VARNDPNKITRLMRCDEVQLQNKYRKSRKNNTIELFQKTNEYGSLM
jgi:hypothetical protein